MLGAIGSSEFLRLGKYFLVGIDILLDERDYLS